MAEVSSNSTPTQCSDPPPKKIKMEENTAADAFKSKGSLSFRIDNFREFTKRLPERETSKRHCDAKVSVRGLSFGLAVCPVRFHTFWQGRRTNPVHTGMSIIVNCENASGCNMKGDGSWSCLALVTIRIKTLLGAMDIDKFTHQFFSGKEESSLEWTSDKPFHFEHLMDPKNGFYNEKEDTLELIVEIAMDPPDGIMELLKTDAIRVNEEMVAINKNHLALYSRFFHNMFYNAQFREGQSGVYEVKIEAPATVEHFKRMMQTLYPWNKPLDDECIEGVLHLADQFLVTVVKGKCLVFLGRKSNKSALTKYRMADKYGFVVLKAYLLENMKATDFTGELFMANLADWVQLGPDAMEALKTRFKALFPSAANIVG